MELQDFFKKCPVMISLRQKRKRNKDAENKLLWFDSCIKSFHRRIFGQLKMKPSQILYKINDSMLHYAKYYIAMLKSVHNMIKNPNTKLPLQIDFMIVPKAMTSSDNGFDNENDDAFID